MRVGVGVDDPFPGRLVPAIDPCTETANLASSQVVARCNETKLWWQVDDGVLKCAVAEAAADAAPLPLGVGKTLKLSADEAVQQCLQMADEPLIIADTSASAMTVYGSGSTTATPFIGCAIKTAGDVAVAWLCCDMHGLIDELASIAGSRIQVRSTCCRQSRCSFEHQRHT